MFRGVGFCPENPWCVLPTIILALWLYSFVFMYNGYSQRVFALNYPFIYTHEFTCLSIIFQYNITVFPDLAKMVVRVWRQVAVTSANVRKDSLETTVKVRYQ